MISIHSPRTGRDSNHACNAKGIFSKIAHAAFHMRLF